jgi:hypothetical protein
MELLLKARRTSGALTAQGERTSRRMYGDFHAHGHGVHIEPISEFSRHRRHFRHGGRFSSKGDD